MTAGEIDTPRWCDETALVDAHFEHDGSDIPDLDSALAVAIRKCWVGRQLHIRMDEPRKKGKLMGVVYEQEGYVRLAIVTGTLTLAGSADF